MAIATLKEEYLDGTYKYFEFTGLSTDTKPVASNIATGSIFCEVNTGKVYFYDSEGDSGSEWIEQFSFQS